MSTTDTTSLTGHPLAGKLIGENFDGEERRYGPMSTLNYWWWT
jgi:hypothetical protein